MSILDELCVLYLNGVEIYVLPGFNPMEDDPYIDSLSIFLGVDEDQNAVFEKAPESFLALANGQLYDDIMDQYETETADESTEHAENPDSRDRWDMGEDVMPRCSCDSCGQG